MSLFRNVLLACLSILMWAGPLSGAVLQVHGDGDTKPADPAYVPTRLVFDCTPRAIIPLTVWLSSSLIDSTTGGTNLIDSYPCAPWQEMGPEHIYQLDVAAGDTLEFWAGFRNVDPLIDLDLFLLNGCDTDSCLIGANTELTAILTGGSYYLIVDGAGSASNFAEGPYTLEYTTRYVGVSPEICAPGVATEVDIGQAESTFEGNLFGLFNYIQSYDCSPILLKGGEKWYTLTLPPPVGNQFGSQDFSEFKVEFLILAPTLDVALWLFDGCGANAVCLDYVNDKIGGIGETMTYRNETDQEITVYLGVDCFRAPTESGTGYFTIKFASETIVPTKKTSFGSLRALYR